MKDLLHLPAAGRFKRFWPVFPLLALAACGGPDEPQYGEMPPPAVTALVVQPEDVEFRAHYAGRVRGAREVEIRARVGGILEQRLYTEGTSVQQGEPLFQIDPEPFQIALRQAEAEVANGQAAFNQAQREWRRISSLFDQAAVSERERDRAISEMELSEARLQSAQARLAEARLNLGYTRVQAPISGTTGLETLPEGSLIERGELLARIVQQDPVHVFFSVPESEGAIRRAARQPEALTDESRRREARLLLADGSYHERSGAIDFADSTIDPQTGTVSLRAVFANPDGELVPGQFVRIELLLQQFEDVFAIDPAAIGQGSSGPRVFVVNGENTAEARDVQLGPLVNGRQIILDGLAPGDRLVINGQVALRDGVPVQPHILEQEAD